MASKPEDEFRNWVKVQMALRNFKSALIPFIKDCFSQFYDASLKNITTNCKVKYQCKSCDIRTLQPKNSKESVTIQCPENGACGEMVNLITKEHVGLSPMWSNTRSELWADIEKGPWEIMKCFVKQPGINDTLSIEEAGVAELIQICTNSKSFRNKMGEENMTVIEQIGEFRNELYHSGDKIILEQDIWINQFIEQLITVYTPLAFDPVATSTDALSRYLKLEDPHDEDVQNQIQQLSVQIKEIRQLAEEGKDINQIRQIFPNPELPEKGKKDAPGRFGVGLGGQPWPLHSYSVSNKEYPFIQYSDTDLVFETCPMRSKLQAVVERFGRKSKELENLCNVVYSSIRGKLSVEHVYAAYQVTGQRNLTFVVTVKSDGDVIDVEKCLKGLAIEFVIKSPHQTNSDNKETVVPCNLPIQEEDIKKLRNCITTHADQLRANHRYLSMIKGFMHKVNNPSSENENQYEARLAMFVHAQGYIPIDEEPIKKNIDGIQVDVREGAFMLHRRQPADAVLTDISMGCQISRDGSGTLSLFFEHPDHGLCGITSAHVLLSADELIQCKDKSSHFSVSDSDVENDVENDVYQPDFSPVRDNVIGKLKEVIYRPLRGLEIAIFSIKKRPPKYGEFPIPTDGTDLGLIYSSGRAYEPRQNRRCVKFGITTGYTEGMIIMPPMPAVYFDFFDAGIMLFDLIEIRPVAGVFSQAGDSGAAVFVQDGDGEPVCIGIHCGVDEFNSSYATPIQSVLEALDISKFKTFSTRPRSIWS